MCCTALALLSVLALLSLRCAALHWRCCFCTALALLSVLRCVGVACCCLCAALALLSVLRCVGNAVSVLCWHCCLCTALALLSERQGSLLIAAKNYMHQPNRVKRDKKTSGGRQRWNGILLRVTCNRKSYTF